MDIYEKYCLKFKSTQDCFVCYFFCLVYIKWLIVWKSLNIGIGTVMKNPEILKFVPDHLKTKKKNM